MCLSDTGALAQDRVLPIINGIKRPVSRPVKAPDAAPAEAPRVLPRGDGPMCTPELPWGGEPLVPTHMGVLLLEPATEAESREVVHQIKSCSRSVTKVADPFAVLAMLRLERDLGAPAGFLASAWCWESAMRPVPLARGDGGASHGFFQMKQWFWDACGLPMTDRVTTDLTMAATCYWGMADHFLQDGRCPGNVIRAEAMAANGDGYQHWGCKAESRHHKELLRWHAN